MTSFSENLEDEEFRMADEILEAKLSHNSAEMKDTHIELKLDLDQSHQNIRPNVYWNRKVEILRESEVIEIQLRTFAYGGTRGSGRKLWNASNDLANFIMKFNSDIFAGKRVLELGCGNTGLPGIAAALCGADVVVFSDCDSLALDELKFNLRQNITRINFYRQHKELFQMSSDIDIFQICPQNQEDFRNKSESSSLQIWNFNWDLLMNHAHTKYKLFDIIIASEVVYDGCNRKSLVHTIDSFLKPDGITIICQNMEGRGGISEFLYEMQRKNFHINEKYFRVKYSNTNDDNSNNHDVKIPIFDPYIPIDKYSDRIDSSIESIDNNTIINDNDDDSEYIVLWTATYL